MDLFQAIVLGVLQGVFEWLPVSSQGQVMGVGIAFLGMSAEAAKDYSLFLHTGTLLSAIVFFRKELAKMLKLENKALSKFIAIAVFATAITAIPSYLALNTIVSLSVPVILLIIALFLFITGFLQSRKKSLGTPGLSNKNALFLGLGQGFAVLPGISRSGTTVSVLLLEGFSPNEAFRLSFLLSIPSVLIGELVLGLGAPVAVGLNEVIALLVAFAVGLASISLLLKLAQKISFSKFCYAFAIFYLLAAFLAV